MTLTEQLRSQAHAITPGGVHSNVRSASPSVFFDHGRGAWLWDVDGKDYLDYLLGQGPNFLGHAHEEVTEAVRLAANRGGVFGSQHALENEAGALLLDTLGWPERVRFGVSGTEADQAALRLARAATGRRSVVRFDGHYHGWLDNVLVRTTHGESGVASRGQIPEALSDFISLPFNDAAAARDAFAKSGAQIAAVILEPMMCNNGAIPPEPGFLELLRELTTRNGAVLIFDEVITGFRLALGGAVERFGVTPDLAVYGKAMAGGWPVAALAGSAAIMDLLADGSVNHSGTFNSSMPSCAAVQAALTILRRDQPYERVEAHGRALMTGILGIADQLAVPMQAQGLPMAFHLSFGEHSRATNLSDLEAINSARYGLLTRALCAEGMWVAPRGIWYVSCAHGDNELSHALERFERALVRFAGEDR